MTVELLLGDCVEEMAKMPDASVDAVVCDPPYGIEFMGKSWDAFRDRDDLDQTDEWDRPRDTPFARRETPRYAGKLLGAKAGPMQVYQAWCETWATEALRVLKPGGHLLAFGGTRTYHRLACAVEDAGFEIRDCIAFMYGSGFPKSLNVSKAIDKAAGVEREVIGYSRGVAVEDDQGFGGIARGGVGIEQTPVDVPVTAPATEDAVRWQGWGTALKPAHEPIVVARKPLVGTVAGNVLAHGTGALNIDGTRIRTTDSLGGGAETGTTAGQKGNDGWTRPWRDDEEARAAHAERVRANVERAEELGRWPANVVLSHTEECVPVGTRKVRGDGNWKGATDSIGYEGGWDTSDHPRDRRVPAVETVDVWDCVPDCPVRMLDAQTGEMRDGVAVRHRSGGKTFGGETEKPPMEDLGYGGLGGASRFFYVAKASRAERNAGCEQLDAIIETRTPMAGRGQGGLKCRVCGKWKVSGSPCRCPEPDFETVAFDRPAATNRHPTVKPVALMRWLVRLVTPPAGVVLDPFLGSGTTGIAAVLEGFRFVGVERDPEYLRIAEARIAFWQEHGEGALRIVAERDQADRRRRDVEDAGQLTLLGGAS